MPARQPASAVHCHWPPLRTVTTAMPLSLLLRALLANTLASLPPGARLPGSRRPGAILSGACLLRSSLLRASLLGACLLGACLPAAAASPAHAGQDPALVQARVVEFLQDQAASMGGAPEISVVAGNTERFAECDSLNVFIAGNGRLRARMSVGVRCDAPAPWTTYVQASIKINGAYYIASQGIAAGQAITPANVTTRQGDILALPQGAVLDAGQLTGAVAARRIAAGTTLRANALRSAQAVQRGRTVRLVINGNGFVATSEGEALESGPPGGFVQVRTASGQIVSGIVRDAGTVEIPL